MNCGQGFRLFWGWKSKPRGRPRIAAEVQKLIVEMAYDNPARGEEHIAAELLLKLGIRISPRNVRRYMPVDTRSCVSPKPNRLEKSQAYSWPSFWPVTACPPRIPLQDTPGNYDGRLKFVV